MDLTLSILISVAMAATPLLLAATGELVTEKSGVLNLGVEGMMLVGAVTAFAVASTTGSYFVGTLAGALGGMAMATLFALLTLGLLANQVATGLALTLAGVGLSALAGKEFVGHPIEGMPRILGVDGLVILSLALVVFTHWLLYKSRAGLVLRAIGENPEAAHAVGYGVRKVRLAAVLYGGACSGLAGAFLSLSYTPMWAENMSAGRGWIALALVVFATWRPARVLLGAYLFGGITIAQLHLQGLGVAIPSQVLAMLPYLATVLVLVLISRDESRIKLNAPASIGKIFYPDR
ncbi:ABC transporter permease [Lacibacterium aquatile]|uniref:ABC transporter permease n=1 Tax=Lacibacterium aquatile TaxID=1168082 RepID=A0ABW5DSE0_9PROT